MGLSDTASTAYNSRLFKVVVFLGIFIPPFSGSFLLSLFNALKSSFSVSIEYIALSLTAYNIGLAVTLLFSGGLSDIYGRKKIILYGYTLFAVGILGSALSQSILFFIFFRLINGIGDALVSPVLFALVGDSVKKELRGRYMSISTTLVLIGWTLGPLSSGFFSTFNWRYLFLITGIVVSILVLIYHFIIPVSISIRKNKNLVLELKDNFLRIFTSSYGIAISVVGFIIFFARMSYFTFLADTLTLPPYSQTDLYIGFIFFVNGLIGVIFGPLTGYINDYLGRFASLIIGSTSVLLIYSSMFFLGLFSDWFPYILIIMVIHGAGYTLLLTTLNTLSVEVIPELRGTLTSFYFSFCSFGFSLAPVLVLPLYLGFGFLLVNLLNSVLMAITTILITLIIRSKRRKGENIV